MVLHTLSSHAIQERSLDVDEIFSVTSEFCYSIWGYCITTWVAQSTLIVTDALCPVVGYLAPSTALVKHYSRARLPVIVAYRYSAHSASCNIG